jgi:hypothetical protein
VLVAVVLGLGLALRVALPLVVRSVMVSQMNAALTGRTEIGDVDLWLFRGAIALEDVALHREGEVAGDPPLVACHRLYVNAGYFALLRRTIRVQDFELEGPAFNLDRRADGSLVLPTPRPTPPPEKLEEAAPGRPWDVLVDRAALRAGRLGIRDYVVDPPESREIKLETLELSNFRFQQGPDAAPGQGAVELHFRDGTVAIGTTVEAQSGGFDVDATVDITNLPLDRLHLHVPELGWSGSNGRLDAALRLHLTPDARPSIAGRFTVRDLRIDVPGEEEPALAWRRLEVAIESFSLIGRSVVVERVALDGAGVILTPREPQPLPLLAARKRLAPAAPPPEEAPGEPAGTPWTWKLRALEVSDSGMTVRLEPPPLRIGVTKASITGLEGAPGSTAHVALELHEGEGTVGVEGTVGLEPLSARANVRLDRLALARLAAASASSIPVRLAGGSLGGTLAVQVAPLVVSGDLGIADLAVASREGEDFSLGWKQLDLAIREVRVPGLVPGERGRAGEPVRVDLERLRLVAPAVAVTRPEAAAAGAAAPQAPVETAPAPAPPTTPLALSLGSLDVEKGEVTLVDQTVKPFYRGRISALALRARGLRYPESVFDDFTLSAALPGSGTLSATGRQRKGEAQLEVTEKRLPLPQFNPYVRQAAGYSITTGTVTVGSKARWSATGYDSQSRIELDQLVVAGAEGDSLFSQRFGVPLTLALGLMRDVHGRIALTVPLKGDRARGMRIDVGSVVAEALARAIVNAIASPLRLLGALSLDGNKVTAFVPEPVEFVPGRPVPVGVAKERLEKLAGVLAAAPAVRVVLSPTAGPADVRGLQEAAVLADLEADQGVLRSLRNMPSRGERRTIREALTARATGEPGELEADARTTLDTWAGEKTVSDGDLRALATARAERVRALLGEQHGIDPGRVTFGEPAIDREQGKPVVSVELGG